jgi:hypothetical protein
MCRSYLCDGWRNMLNLLQRMYYKSSKIREVIHIDVIVFIAYILHFVCSYVFIIIYKLIKLLTLFLFTQVKNLRFYSIFSTLSKTRTLFSLSECSSYEFNEYVLFLYVEFNRTVNLTIDLQFLFQILT